MSTDVQVAYDLTMKDGRTWREQNLEDLHHGIPLGTLVEVQYDTWHGDGACEKIHARLWVVEHTRDCDGEPLYSLCSRSLEQIEDLIGAYFRPNGSLKVPSDLTTIQLAFINLKGGFGEESLTPVEITDDLKRGIGSLEWRD